MFLIDCKIKLPIGTKLKTLILGYEDDIFVIQGYNNDITCIVNDRNQSWCDDIYKSEVMYFYPKQFFVNKTKII